MNIRRILAGLVGLIALSIADHAHAQWLTQTNALKAGWNGVYLHVDASHALLTDIVTPEIEEIWVWRQSPSGEQFFDDPTEAEASSAWAIWKRNPGPGDDITLQRLVGNVGYLVRTTSDVPAWTVKGRPLAPSYEWTSTGVNFVGFQTTATTPPSIKGFFDAAADLSSVSVYEYRGGALVPNVNPRFVSPLETPIVELKRDRAYWVRAGLQGDEYNRYFGPFELTLLDAHGVRFGDTGGQYQIRLRNLTGQPITVTMTPAPSETAPAGQTAVQGQPPLLLRGTFDSTNLTFEATPITAGSPATWDLAAHGQSGSEVVFVVGLDRAQMGGNPGDLFSGIMRFTDSLSLSEVNVSASAQTSSSAGLWVGAAVISDVHHSLKTFETASTQQEFDSIAALAPADVSYSWETNTGRIQVFDADGNGRTNRGHYLLEGQKTDTGATARSFPLRLIIHDDGTDAVLLQRVYYGVASGGTNAILTTQESDLDRAALSSARRISAVHLPWSPDTDNNGYSLGGSVASMGTLRTSIALAHGDQANNPFIHTYHPDHDNLDASFKNYNPATPESYRITREVSLTRAAAGSDFSSRTRGSQTVGGNYTEDITFQEIESDGVTEGDQKTFSVRGTFQLNRLSNIPALLSAQ